MSKLTVNKLRTLTGMIYDYNGYEYEIDDIWHILEKMDNDNERNNWLRYKFD